MKTLLALTTIVLLLVAVPKVHGQIIFAHSFIPASPTDQDVIKIALQYAIPQSGCALIGSNRSVSGNTITISNSYQMGQLTVLCDRTDTFIVGSFLPCGQYTLNILFYLNGTLSPNSFSTSFTVACTPTCSDSIGVSAPAMINNTVMFGGWGVNADAPATYAAQMKMGRGVGNDLHNIPWTDLPSVTLENECTGWVYETSIDLSELRQSDKVMFRVLMSYPNGLQLTSDVVSYVHRLHGMRQTAINNAPSQLQLEAKDIFHSGKGEQTTVLVRISEKNTASSQLNIQAFPNPFHTDFTIKSTSTNIIEISIYDVLGEVKYVNQFVGQKEYEIYPQLAQGIYFLQLKQEGKVSVQKIIVE